MVERPLMVRWVVGSIPHGGPVGVTKAVVGYVLFCLRKVHIKEPLLLIGKSGPCGFLLSPNGPLIYVRRHRM